MVKGNVIWITGLSASGKTTVGKLVYDILRSQYDNVIFLDGDSLREIYGNDLGHTKNDRIAIGMRNAKLCKLLSGQGMIVVCTTISMFHVIRDWNRENIQNYFEIYLKVPLAELKNRDFKNIYKNSDDQIDAYGEPLLIEEPRHPHLILENFGEVPPEMAAQKIISLFNTNFICHG